MADSKYYPDQWREYCRLVAKKTTAEFASWNKFAARYRAASAFQSAEFMQMTEKTSGGYSTGIRLLLSYSAYEYACAAAGVDINSVPVIPASATARKIAKMLGKVFGPETPASTNLTQSIESKRLLARVLASLSGKSHDLQPICAALRHMIAHGQWTPNGTSTITVEGRTLFEALSAQLLRAADSLLEGKVKSMRPIAK